MFKYVNKKELLFMELVVMLVHQFMECSEDDAVLFAVDLLKKMEQYKLRIR